MKKVWILCETWEKFWEFTEKNLEIVLASVLSVQFSYFNFFYSVYLILYARWVLLTNWFFFFFIFSNPVERNIILHISEDTYRYMVQMIGNPAISWHSLLLQQPEISGTPLRTFPKLNTAMTGGNQVTILFHPTSQLSPNVSYFSHTVSGSKIFGEDAWST